MTKRLPVPGITVIVCCYNSANRLLPTLECLCSQRISSEIAWEIVIVDNASTDETAFIAADFWENRNDKKNNAHFSLVREQKQGLAHAKSKGISVAAYEFLLFCDDDNRLSENYVEEMYRILKNDPAIAACGGKGIPVFEGEKPEWFDEYQEAYAVGNQLKDARTGKLLNLYGAGMTINLSAYRVLEKRGFQQFLTGRTGNALSSSEDTELTYAFICSGYKLHFEPGLEFKHFISEARLSYNYLHKLFRSFGKDGPVRNLYYAHISDHPHHQMIKSWSRHLGLALFRMVKYQISPPKKNGRRIYWNWSLAYIRELLSLRKKHKSIVQSISNLNIHKPRLSKQQSVGSQYAEPGEYLIN